MPRDIAAAEPRPGAQSAGGITEGGGACTPRGHSNVRLEDSEWGLHSFRGNSSAPQPGVAWAFAGEVSRARHTKTSLGTRLALAIDR